jgi:hypothetical protein
MKILKYTKRNVFTNSNKNTMKNGYEQLRNIKQITMCGIHTIREGREVRVLMADTLIDIKLKE